MGIKPVRAWVEANPLTAMALGFALTVTLAFVPAGSWTLLELVRLAAQIALPVALILFGLRLERRKVANQELVRKRIAVYDHVAFRLNDILCFYKAVGGWAAMNPDTVIQAKREADRQMYVYRALFSERLFKAYSAFNDACFRTHSDPAGGAPAKLKLDLAHVRREMGARFDTEWLKRVHEPPAGEPPSSVARVEAAYRELMAEFAREIGVEEDDPPPRAAATY
jgi:hypothetical protein